MAEKQNDVSSIVVELDYPVDISEVSRVMENLLLSFAEQLMRYKGMLWIDGEPNRLLFRACSASTAPTGIARGAMKRRTARWCLSAFSCRRGNSRGVCRVTTLTARLRPKAQALL
nr:GTP-binding protein [Klebsiella pneumoniae subsp. pneumoniae]